MSNWTKRRAAESRICDNCDSHIRPNRIYWLMDTGQRFCCSCPPDGEEEDICVDDY